MESLLQRCQSCGYQRPKAPSAYPICCGQPMETVCDPDIWHHRTGARPLREADADPRAESRSAA